MRMKLPWQVACAALMLPAAVAGCADDRLGELRLALSFEGQDSFRLQVFAGTVGSDLEGDVQFDSGCVKRRSTTLELSQLPVSAAYSIVYRAWSDAACAGDPLAFGFRGGVSLEADQAVFVHVPVYATGLGTLLPVDLNLSALASTPVESCSNEDVCTSGDSCISTDEGSWCVPTCAVDTDCVELHPQARCETAAGWCFLDAPWPLNASEPRAFARAMTRTDGSVVVFGGMHHTRNGRLEATTFPVELFEASTGIFKALDIAGFFGGPAAAFGFATFGNDRIIVAGGLRAAAGVTLDAQGPKLEANWRTDGVDRVFVIDFSLGRALSAPLGQIVGDPGVADLGGNRFMIAGGRTLQGQNNVVNSDKTWVCAIDSEGALGCEAGPTLRKARVAPALVCVDTGGQPCGSVIVFGGNEGGNAQNLAEVIDFNANPPTVSAFDVVGVPPVVLSPVFCGTRLVGGAAPDGMLSQFDLQPSTNPADAAPPEQGPVFPVWAAHSADGCGFVGGGIVDGIPGPAISDSIWTTSANGTLVRASGDLGRVRAAAAAGRVGSGPLAGSWLILGGLEPGVQGNDMRVVNGAEIWRP